MARRGGCFAVQREATELLQVMRIELDERRAVQVTAEGWHGPMRRTFGANRLCTWYPKDPPNRQWNRADGVLKLSASPSRGHRTVEGIRHIEHLS